MRKYFVICLDSVVQGIDISVLCKVNALSKDLPMALSDLASALIKRFGFAMFYPFKSKQLKRIKVPYALITVEGDQVIKIEKRGSIPDRYEKMCQ